MKEGQKQMQQSGTNGAEGEAPFGEADDTPSSLRITPCVPIVERERRSLPILPTNRKLRTQGTALRGPKTKRASAISHSFPSKQSELQRGLSLPVMDTRSGEEGTRRSPRGNPSKPNSLHQPDQGSRVAGLDKTFQTTTATQRRTSTALQTNREIRYSRGGESRHASYPLRNAGDQHGRLEDNQSKGRQRN